MEKTESEPPLLSAEASSQNVKQKKPKKEGKTKKKDKEPVTPSTVPNTPSLVTEAPSRITESSATTSAEPKKRKESKSKARVTEAPSQITVSSATTSVEPKKGKESKSKKPKKDSKVEIPPTTSEPEIPTTKSEPEIPEVKTEPETPEVKTEPGTPEPETQPKTEPETPGIQSSTKASVAKPEPKTKDKPVVKAGPSKASTSGETAPPIREKSRFSRIAYRFSKCILTVAVFYFFGYYRISPGWLLGPVLMYAIHDEWDSKKKAKLKMGRMAAADEREAIVSHLGDLPSWVFFPDVERAEWLNRIIKRLWPNVNTFTRDLVKESIEPSIQEKLKNFRFKTFQLGLVPPRVGGIKVYEENVSNKEIVMDVEIIYAGDCDITFSVKNISGGLEDLQLKGIMRVVMKPLIPKPPLIGALQLFFLNNPSLDFNLVGITNLLDMPGLNDAFRKAIMEQIALRMVLPNKFPVVLNDTVPIKTLKFPDIEGVLRVNVIEGKDLEAKDIGMMKKATSDPYAKLYLGSEVFTSQVIPKNLNPKWDFWCEFSCEAIEGQLLWIEVYDEDKTSKDDPLGKKTLELKSLIEKVETDQWLELEDVKTGKIHVKTQWVKLSSDAGELKSSLDVSRDLSGKVSGAVLSVYVESARGLPKIKNNIIPDARFEIQVGKVVKKSASQARTDCPVYEEGFVFLVNNPETDSLFLKFEDAKTKTALGSLEYKLNKVLGLDNMEVKDEPLPLKGAGMDSTVVLSMKMRILNPSKK